MTHTPGPWKPVRGVDDDDTRWIVVQAMPGAPEYVLATIENGAPGDSLETEAANADLLAAAPELLAACKLALGAFERNDAINWDDLARAIDKAEGRTSSQPIAPQKADV